MLGERSLFATPPLKRKKKLGEEICLRLPPKKRKKKKLGGWKLVCDTPRRREKRNKGDGNQFVTPLLEENEEVRGDEN